jgi:hypothetical protein
MNFSGLANEPFLGDDLYAMPDAMNAEMAEIDSNARAITGGPFHGDVMGSDTSQGEATEANAVYADAFGGDAYDTEDTFEQDLLDAETVSQGKKLPTSRILCANN